MITNSVSSPRLREVPPLPAQPDPVNLTIDRIHAVANSSSIVPPESSAPVGNITFVPALPAPSRSLKEEEKKFSPLVDGVKGTGRIEGKSYKKIDYCGGFYEGWLENDEPNGRGVYTHPNGTVIFEGQFKDGVPCDGKLIYPDGAVYQGKLKDNAPTGKGMYAYPDGKVFEGQFEDGIPCDGKLTYPDGAVYQGPFRNSLPTGKGMYAYSDGKVFEGQFEDGLPSNGKLTYPDKAVYQGPFRNSLPHGIGEYTYPPTEFNNRRVHTYVGEFRDGKFYDGKLTYPDGSNYIGLFEKNFPHGLGVLTSENSSYVGMFQNGLPNGRGKKTYYDRNNTLYDGLFLNGEYSGDGILTSNKKTYSGQFKNGKYNGTGTLKYKSGVIYKGQFQNGMFHGIGKLKLSTGEIFEGSFLNDRIHGIARYTYPHGRVINEEEFEQGKSSTGRVVFDREAHESLLENDQINQGFCIIL